MAGREGWEEIGAGGRDGVRGGRGNQQRDEGRRRQVGKTGQRERRRKRRRGNEERETWRRGRDEEGKKEDRENNKTVWENKMEIEKEGTVRIKA